MMPWDAKGKALLLVRHETRLEYGEPVVEAHSEVRKTPVDTGLQRVVTTKLELDPPAPMRGFVDYFGTRVVYFNLLEPHRDMTITSESVVETRDAVCCGPETPADSRPWRVRMAEFLHWSRSVPPLPHYAEIHHGVSAELAPDRFLAELAGLGAAFRERFRYDPEATDVHSSPEVLFERGGGVCQDVAHALLGVLRLAGVACRYASGYIYDPGRDGDGGIGPLPGSNASHAWVQAFHPELGWVGVDPTHSKLVDWQYVRVAVGRDYTDVQPLRGVFVGNPEQRLSVDVSVRRIG
jgi:transglutaminase-like putative cysteine protease